MLNDSSSKPQADTPPAAIPAGPLRMWGPVAALAIVLLTYASQVFASILGGIYVAVVGERNALLSDGSPTPMTQFFLVLLVEIMALTIIWAFLRARHISFGKGVGISWKSFKANHIWYAVVGFLVYLAFIFIFTIIAKYALPFLDTEQEQAIGFETSSIGTSGLVLAFVSLVILPPIAEEMIFRGFLFGAMRGKMKFVYATLITSVVFGAMHLLGAKSGLLWIGAIDTFLLSLVLCYLRQETGTIWSSIMVHALKNLMAFMVLFKIFAL